MNLTKINFSKNPALTSKAGVFLGDALIENCTHPVGKLSFKKVCLAEDGLLRILEAANVNSFLVNLNLGYVTDRGLKIMAKCLKINKNLEKLKFTEHQDYPWSNESKVEFVEMLKLH